MGTVFRIAASDDLNNDGLMDAIVHPNGWIPLYEDVVARTLRPINKTHTRSHGHSADAANLSDNIDHISRYSFEADFTVPFLEGWEGSAAYTHGYRELQFMSNQNYDITAMQQGLNCDIVYDRSACYSPFLIVNPEDNNSVHVMNAVAGRSIEVIEDKLTTVDIIINGEVPLGGFELPGGPIGAALGYQFRDDKYLNIPSEEELAGVTWIGSSNRERASSGSRNIDAYFAEFALPVLDTVEVELAVRHEEFSTGQTATVPEYGITFAPLDWLTLRAHRGRSVHRADAGAIAESGHLRTRYGERPVQHFRSLDHDPAAAAIRIWITRLPDSKQLGFDIAFDDFDFSADMGADRLPESNRRQERPGHPQRGIRGVQAGDRIFGSGKPSLDQLQAWVNDPRSNKQIPPFPGRCRHDSGDLLPRVDQRGIREGHRHGLRRQLHVRLRQYR